MIQMIIGILTGIGAFLIILDLKRAPYYKTLAAVDSITKGQKNKRSRIDVWLGGFSDKISKLIKMDEFKRARLEADLRATQMNISPEKYKADAIVKASIVGVFAIPVYFVFPLLSPFILILAIVFYSMENKKVSKRIKEKREKIEFELPRLVFTIEKTLKHNRDVLFMLDSYRDIAGKELGDELSVTVADMKSGNYESAITRLESRLNSPMVSDVCRGLIGILRGDDTEIYWATLEIKFKDEQKQILKREAAKAPRKVKRLSMCLLICFMLTYVVVILSQIMGSITTLFG